MRCGPFSERRGTPAKRATLWGTSAACAGATELAWRAGFADDAQYVSLLDRDIDIDDGAQEPSASKWTARNREIARHSASFEERRHAASAGIMPGLGALFDRLGAHGRGVRTALAERAAAHLADIDLRVRTGRPR
jgi:hypothetical protein